MNPRPLKLDVKARARRVLERDDARDLSRAMMAIAELDEHDILHKIARERLRDLVEASESPDELAERWGLSSRQVRRIVEALYPDPRMRPAYGFASYLEAKKS